MAVRADTWMPFYVADYLKDTMRLTTEQHGAYLLLIMACWTGGGILPAKPDQLAATAKLSLSSWRKVAPVVMPYFKRSGPSYTHTRVTEELEKAQRLSDIRRESGARGGRPKTKTDSKSKPIAIAKGKQTGSQTETPSPSPSSNEESEAIASSLSARERRRKPECSIPEGFPDSEAIGWAEAAVAAASSMLSVAEHVSRFRNYNLAHDRRVRDWLAAWRGWIEIEIGKAPTIVAASPQPEHPKWPGPADVRAAVALAIGEPKTRAYLDHCGWRDIPDRAVTTTSITIAKALTAEAENVLGGLGVRILHEKADAA